MNCSAVAPPVKRAKTCVPRKITYHPLFWLFVFGSVAGLILEGMWCVIRKGAWESHASLVWGPFCIIYGFGAVAVYLIAMILKGKRLPLQFLLFSAAGALVEYFGSLFQEMFFGSTSWDYSSHFMNIGGRVSLKMALAWGVLGIIFVRFVFPSLVRLLGKMEGRFWRIGCVVFSVFMAVNFLMSAAAIMRWRDRLADNPPPVNAVERFLDETYDNETMEKNYPNMKFTEQELNAH